MFKIKLNKDFATPKYVQLLEAILENIKHGYIIEGEALPSINSISKEQQISRETIFKTFKILKERGIIKSVDKVGYFVKSTKTVTEYNILLILDKFTIFKERIYLGIMDTFGKDVRITIFYHHHNIDLFERELKESLANYSHFIVTTFFGGSQQDRLNRILENIPKHKRFIIDNFEEIQVSTNSGLVYQDFKKGIIDNLLLHKELIKTYNKIVLIKDQKSYHGEKVEDGLKVVSETCGIALDVVDETSEIRMMKGILFITIDGYEKDLIKIVKLARGLKWRLGNGIGLISYNDTPAKEVICGGITVITTDFYKMGKIVAKMIIQGKQSSIECLSYLIKRKSF